MIAPNEITNHSLVYSFGIGTDVTFDLELINRYGVCVHAFDPTPRSIAWVKSQQLPEIFTFHPWGVDGKDGRIKFFAPDSDDHVSFSATRQTAPLTNAPDREVICPVFRLHTIMERLGHDHLDLLKMDIEGAEYAVFDDLAAHPVPIRQIVVEFHHWQNWHSARQTRLAISQLKRLGFRIFHITPNGYEYSFINTKP